MRPTPSIGNVRFHPADRELRREGMLGWASFTVDQMIHLDAVAVRRTHEGRWSLAFPRPRAGQRVVRSHARPLTDDVRAGIEAQVIGELRRRGYVS